MLTNAVVLCALYLSTYTNLQAIGQTMQPEEVVILCNVAQEYKLTSTERVLLFAIRKQENGTLGNGLEMGVGDGKPDHPARRFKGDKWKSLQCQARWAAGTIDKRFTGSVELFAQRYAEDWKTWKKNVTHWMERKVKNGWVHAGTQ